jgi:hypothetical protein
MYVAIVVAILMSATACDILAPVNCTDILLPGIVVHVADSATSRPVPGRVAVSVRDGTFVDSTGGETALPSGVDVDSVYHGPFYRAFEREGTYRVDVQAPGYKPWSRSGVRVNASRCHVETVELHAEMQS